MRSIRHCCWLMALSILITSVPGKAAQSSFKNGNKLQEECSAPKSDVGGMMDWASCTGYIVASIDAYLSFRADNGMSSCLAGGVNTGQVRDIVIAYLRDHPSERHWVAAQLVAKSVAPLIVSCSVSPVQ